MFDQDTGDSPLYKPVTKLEAPAQVSGKVQSRSGFKEGQWLILTGFMSCNR